MKHWSSTDRQTARRHSGFCGVSKGSRGVPPADCRVRGGVEWSDEWGQHMSRGYKADGDSRISRLVPSLSPSPFGFTCARVILYIFSSDAIAVLPASHPLLRGVVRLRSVARSWQVHTASTVPALALLEWCYFMDLPM